MDHETVAAVSKFKAQPLQTKEGKKKKKTKKTSHHQHNFRRSSAFGARFRPSDFRSEKEVP